MEISQAKTKRYHGEICKIKLSLVFLYLICDHYEMAQKVIAERMTHHCHSLRILILSNFTIFFVYQALSKFKRYFFNDQEIDKLTPGKFDLNLYRKLLTFAEFPK